MKPDEWITELEDGLSMVACKGNDGFESFLAQGGALSDRDDAVYIPSTTTDDSGTA